MLLQLFLVGLLLLLIFKLNQRDKNLPPGEWGLPIVGVLPYFGGNPKRYFNSVKHKYGNIFYVRLGSRIAVFIRDIETIKKELVKTELALRPDLFTFSAFNIFKNYGILMTSGPVWESNRRFTLRHLRDFGFGKSNKMQDIILLEAETIVKSLESNLGEPIRVDETLNIASVSVIWNLIAGMRLDPKNPKMTSFSKIFEEDVRTMDGRMSIMNFIPSLVYLLPSFVKNKWLNVEKFVKNRSLNLRYMEEIVDEHQATLDRDNPRDYIDAFLIAMEDEKDSEVAFKDPIPNLIWSINDVFVAAMDTTAATLRWFILFMGSNPHIQERIQKELDSVLSRGEFPLLEHKDKLPYLQAAVQEVLRHRPIAHFAIPHSPQDDYYIHGYKIPKGSMVFPCIYDVQHDPQHWERPEEFYPGHFLDDDGAFKMRTEAFIPFSYGKRMCLGDSVAKMELFMFAGAILQSYKISFPKGAKVNLVPDDSVLILSYPEPFKVVLEKRM